MLTFKINRVSVFNLSIIIISQIIVLLVWELSKRVDLLGHEKRYDKNLFDIYVKFDTNQTWTYA